jgi:hypothetical protein
MGDGGPGGARVPLTYGLAARVPVNLKSTGGMEKQTLDRWALSLLLVLSKRAWDLCGSAVPRTTVFGDEEVGTYHSWQRPSATTAY